MEKEKEKTVIIDDISDENGKNLISEIENRFNEANEKTFKIIEDFLSSGYEEFLARLLAYLPKDHQEKTVSQMPENLRERILTVAKDLGEKKPSDADVLSTVAYVLKEADFYGEKMASFLVENENASFVNKMHDCAENLFSVNPLLAMNLEYYLVNLDILIEIDDRSIQKWLREVESNELAKALKGSSKAVQEKIFRNMSHRAAAMLQEDMEFMGPVQKSDVLETQKKLVGILKRLETSGDIIIPCSAFGGLGEETL